MRQKKRYLLSYYNGSDNALDAIKAQYAEKFGAIDLEKASLEVISYKDGFLTLRCNLGCLKHLLETVASTENKFVTLNLSGTLKALRSRENQIKKRFIGE